MSICTGHRSMLKRLSGTVSRLVSRFTFSFMDRFAYRNRYNMFTANKTSLSPPTCTRTNFCFWRKNVALLSDLKYFLRKLNQCSRKSVGLKAIVQAVRLVLLETQCRQIPYGNRITSGKYVDQDSSVGIAAKRRG